MILGRIGSGKSSLLAAILGEMNIVNGSINFKKSVIFLKIHTVHLVLYMQAQTHTYVTYNNN